MRRIIILAIACLLSVSAFGQFDPGCPLPARYEAVKQHHPIDDTCKIDGPQNSAAEKKSESSAKNDFCATGNPVTITVTTLKSLQGKVDAKRAGGDKKFGKKADRSELEDLVTTSGHTVGEGSLVRFTGFILDAHYSNVGKGETVNCKTGGQEFNDIHIVVASSPTEKNMCKTVTAEMTPHLRPEVWTADNLDKLQGTKVRFTGHLFFDSAHNPCKQLAEGSFQKASPARISVWEVHPVYSLDVCEAASCAADSDAGWTSFEEFIGAMDEEEPAP
jgi:hypothetical protein